MLLQSYGLLFRLTEENSGYYEEYEHKDFLDSDDLSGVA